MENNRLMMMMMMIIIIIIRVRNRLGVKEAKA